MRPDWLLLFLPLPLGFLLDALLGDPVWLYHPVRIIGWGIVRSEKLLRRLFPGTAGGERAAGRLLAAGLPLASAMIFAGMQWLAWRYALWLWFALETMLSYQLLAAKELKTESMAVYSKLAAGDLAGARTAVARIVGRDTAALDEGGVARAAVESVAENTTDGVVAPLLWTALGGAALGLWYKAVNTLDSMVGYKNERYLHLGRASARLDDAASFLPARAAAGMMLLAAEACGYDKRGAARIYKRDRRKHQSPNSAHTEAVTAGALGIRLGGDAVYFGELRHKPGIGDALRPVGPEDIVRANRLMTGTSYLCLLCASLLRGAVILLLSGYYYY